MCDHLAQTQLTGHPEEWLTADSWEALLARYGVDQGHRLVEAVIEAATGDNGVFGLRMGSPSRSLPHLLTAVQTVTEESGLDGIWAALGPPTFVWATRRDKVRQAISWWRAIQSGRWQSSDPAAASPTSLDCDAIERLLHSLVHHEAIWGHFFERVGAVPLTVVYEDWTRRREDTLSTILRAVGESPVGVPPDSVFERMADEQSEQWYDEMIYRLGLAAAR